jgi:flagellar hook-associated protein 2
VSGTLLASTGTSSGTQSDDASGGTLYTIAQLDAVFTLDGLTITRGSNTVSDVLSGVTISLLAPQTSDALPVSLSVGPDQSAIQSKVQAFLDAYNTTIKFLNERTSVKVDASTSGSGSTDVQSVTRGSLSGDPTYLGLMMNLRSDVGGRITTGLAGGALALSEIGITTAADGTLSISDSSKFNKALSEKPDGIAALFNSTDGIASRVSARLATFVATGGVLDNSLRAVTARIGTLNDAIKAQEALLKIRQDQLTQQLDALAQVAAQVTLQQEIVTYALSSGTF